MQHIEVQEIVQQFETIVSVSQLGNIFYGTAIDRVVVIVDPTPIDFPVVIVGPDTVWEP